MNISSITELEIPSVKLIGFEHFQDNRGYFTETFRISDIMRRVGGSLGGVQVLQINQSHSLPGVCRGLHFQWNPYMGKLVRVIEGQMFDFVLDIRKHSPHYGKILCVPMDSPFEWIWVPPGFAHGNFFPTETTIEYLCTGEHSPGCEAGISLFSKDINWDFVDPTTRDTVLAAIDTISDKDQNAMSLTDWSNDPRSAHFVFGVNT